MKCVLCLCPCVLHFLVMSRNKILCSMYHARFPKCTHSMQRALESWKAISDFCTVKGIGPENIACKRSEMKIFCTYVCKLFKLWFMCLSQRILSRQKERQLFLFPQKAPHVFFYEGRKKKLAPQILEFHYTLVHRVSTRELVLSLDANPFQVVCEVYFCQLS